MYTPKLPDKFIVALYQEAQKQKKPMTLVLKDIVGKYLDKKGRGVNIK